MSEAPDGAAAPAAPAPAPVIDEVVSPPNPIRSDPQLPEPKAKDDPKPETKPASIKDSIRKAAEKVEKDAPAPDKAKPVEAKAADKAAEKPEAKPGASRDESTGRFAPDPAKAPEKAAGDEAPKDQQRPRAPHDDAPARFSPDAKAKWAATDESVRAETTRAMRELETGLNQHKERAERFKDVEEYDSLARQHNTTIKAALDRYTSLEKGLRSNNPMPAIEEIFRYSGLSLRDVAAKIAGQAPDEVRSQSDATIRALQNEVAQLKQAIGGVTTTINDQRQGAIKTDVEKFAAEHPRFDELAGEIAEFLQHGFKGKALDLAGAYELADRLNPGAAPAPAAKPSLKAIDPDPADQTRKGEKSIAGAPSPGSNPVNSRPPSPTIKAALRRAIAAAG